jgi:hypothetical protein
LSLFCIPKQRRFPSTWISQKEFEIKKVKEPSEILKPEV